MRITIRRATVDDLPWLRHLVAAFMAEPIQSAGYPAFDAEELDTFTLIALRSLSDPTSLFRCWLAWRGKTAVACLGGEIQTRLVGKPHQFANALWAYVQPEYRGGDVGWRLLDAFAGWAESLGVKMMECRAQTGDTRYADHGYPQISTEYAAPVATVRERWRQHVQKTEAPAVEPPQPNGHDTTAVIEVPA
jgi:GNAT superfamily N-acetyltransferase